jgi:hypothetical protein
MLQRTLCLPGYSTVEKAALQKNYEKLTFWDATAHKLFGRSVRCLRPIELLLGMVGAGGGHVFA